MLFLLSPAKTLDYDSDYFDLPVTEPAFLKDSARLIKELKELSVEDISALMSLSEKLSTLNHERYKNWKRSHKESGTCRPALLTFKGDVYQGLDAPSWKKSDFNHAQKHLRILSGLYGILKPLDLMQAYRLEMGTKFENSRGKNLYEFWGSILYDALNVECAEKKYKAIVNLASNEYFTAAKEKELQVPVITPVFKDYKNGKYKIISFYAKRARGTMASWAIRNRVKKAEDLTQFAEDGYVLDAESSYANTLTFLRKLS